MAQSGAFPQSNFSKGWLTEVNLLDYPDNFLEVGQNIEIELNGDIRRRLAIGGEPGYEYSTLYSKATTVGYSIQKFMWNNPTGLGTLDFFVMRFGNVLHFYEVTSSSISPNKKSFTVNLDTFKVLTATDMTVSPIQFASDTTKLFVVGTGIEPFYVAYNPTTDTISTITTTIRVRDFDDLDPNTANETELATLTPAQDYDLKNRGWSSPGAGIADPRATYFSSKGVYPPKSKAPWQGKSDTGDFDVAFMAKLFAGNSSAAKGRYILNYFSQDRATASGVAGIPVETLTDRPQAVGFYSGRVWYGYKGDLFYTQAILADEDIGRCYQENDPTSEEISDLLDTDGGYLPIKGASLIRSINELGNYLIVLDEEGVWAITGADGIFKATGYSISKISNEGISSSDSVIDFKQGVAYWGRNGIFVISIDPSSQSPVVTNITEGKIDTEYGKIPLRAKKRVTGAYDRFRKELVWSYNTDQFIDTDKHQYVTDILKFKVTTGAFIPPIKIPTPTASYPLVAEVFATKIPSYRQRTENVTVGGTAVTVGGDPVTVQVNQLDEPEIGLKQIVIIQDGSNIKWTFAEMNDTGFLDFKDFDATGTDYESYFEPGHKTFGDLYTRKTAPVIYCFFKRTETDFSVSGDDYILNNPSGCKMLAKWDWTDTTDSNRWTNEIVAYRFTRSYVVDPVTLAFNYGTSVIETKSKLRGSGKALKIRFTSETGKDFQMLGWALILDKYTKK